MWSYALVAGMGAVLATRSKPKSQCLKSLSYGARSGMHWDVEEFPEAHIVLVRSQVDPTVAAFRKTPAGHELASFRGDKRVVKLMCADFLKSKGKKVNRPCLD